MKINLLLLAFTFIAAGTYTYITTNVPQPIFSQVTQSSLQLGKNSKALKDFTYTTIKGMNGNLYSNKGQVTLVHFWATWCAPCLIELPELIKLAQNQKHITVLAVSTDQDLDRITGFMKKTTQSVPENFILITDPDKRITQDIFQTVRLPETFILTPALGIHEKIIGASDAWMSGEMIEKLEKLSRISEESTE
jgi:thiol-disulfide isomerase/thioredoxin